MRYAKTGNNGITTYRVSGGKGGMGCNTLAESGTNQLEFNYVAQVTGDSHFGKKSATFYPYMDKKKSLDGLYPNCFERGTGKITFGADGDSFYEYLVKVWLQTGRKDDRLWRMYQEAIDGLEKWLVHKGKDGLTYLANINWFVLARGKRTYVLFTARHLVDKETCDRFPFPLVISRYS